MSPDILTPNITVCDKESDVLDC